MPPDPDNPGAAGTYSGLLRCDCLSRLSREEEREGERTFYHTEHEKEPAVTDITEDQFQHCATVTLVAAIRNRGIDFQCQGLLKSQAKRSTDDCIEEVLHVSVA